MVPQRFFTHGQASRGDRHVHAARTRFILPALLGLFAGTTWPVVADVSGTERAASAIRIDIGERMRGMWGA